MPKIKTDADTQFAAAMRGAPTFSGKPAPALAVVPKTPRAPDPNAIVLGVNEIAAGDDMQIRSLQVRSIAIRAPQP